MSERRNAALKAVFYVDRLNVIFSVWLPLPTQELRVRSFGALSGGGWLLGPPQSCNRRDDPKRA
jgi:hypothetical protein